MKISQSLLCYWNRFALVSFSIALYFFKLDFLICTISGNSPFKLVLLFSLIYKCIVFISPFLPFFDYLIGRPQPQVRWLVNGLLVDNQNEHNSGDVIENRLLWPSVQRNDLNSVFTCQALNTQLDKPKEKSFILDMHCK